MNLSAARSGGDVERGQDALRERGLLAAGVVAAVGVLLVVAAPRLEQPLMIFALPILAAGGCLLITRRQWALLGLVFATYADLPRVLSKVHGVPSPNVLLWLLVAAAVTYGWLRHGSRALPRAFVFVPLAIYWFVCFASGSGAEFTSQFVDRLEDYSKALLIGLSATLALERKEDLRPVVATLMAATLLMSAITTVQFLTQSHDSTFFGFGQVDVHWLGGEEQFRSSGPTADPNFYGLVLVGGIPIALGMFLTSSTRRGRWLALLCVGTAASALFLTFSRGSLIGLVAALFFMALRWRPKGVLVAGVLLMACLVMPFAPTGYAERLAAVPVTILDVLNGGSGAEGSTRGRISEALVAFEMFRQHPIRGVGIGNYPPLYQDFRLDLGLDPRTTEREPHSLYLETAAETGVLGLFVGAVILILLASSVRSCTRSFDDLGRKREAGLAWTLGASLVGVLTCSVLLHAAKPNHLWLLIALGMALGPLGQQRVEDSGLCEDAHCARGSDDEDEDSGQRPGEKGDRDG